MEAEKQIGKQVSIQGHIHAIRKMGKIAFLVLRDRNELTQVLIKNVELLASIEALSLETVIRVEGVLAAQPNSKDVELQAEAIQILSSIAHTLPIEINKSSRVDNLALSTLLDYRPISLRAEKVKAIFKIEAAICAAFRGFLTKNAFVEIHTPKIVATGTEGGAQLFTVDYFGRKAYLAQSPQFYKQIMIGVFERVFEIGPVYRAEEHDTTRHLNEYISMDFEMGFIESEQELIALQTKLLQHIFSYLLESCSCELQLFSAKIPTIEFIPQLTHQEAIRLLEKEFNWNTAADLDPEAERLLCQYFQEKEGSEFVYINKYPSALRPFYAVPIAGGLSASFDLLYKGLEVTTGGQRIHKYNELIERMQERKLEIEKFEYYLQCFKYGMPPHGGLAIGLERLAKQLLNLSSVKLSSLFPRDINRLIP